MKQKNNRKAFLIGALGVLFIIALYIGASRIVAAAQMTQGSDDKTMDAMMESMGSMMNDMKEMHGQCQEMMGNGDMGDMMNGMMGSGMTQAEHESHHQ